MHPMLRALPFPVQPEHLCHPHSRAAAAACQWQRSRRLWAGQAKHVNTQLLESARRRRLRRSCSRAASRLLLLLLPQQLSCLLGICGL